MPVIIPMKNLPSFTEEITLDSIPYVLRFDYNSRGEDWYISFYDRDKILLASGIKLLLHYELIADYPDIGLPPGELWVFDSTDNLSNPGRDGFTNERLSLVYYSENEL